ncbi:Rib/alpha-like domain-containing protein, partial [Lactiplantibacillus plantarum]
PDTSTPGDKSAVVIVTYPDGTTDKVPVTIHVTSQADEYTPKGQDQMVEENSQPSAANSISNRGDLPDGTTYTWDKTPDTSTPGDKSAVVIVTYPDGTTDKVPVTIHVTSQADGITNKRGLPEGPNYTLKANPDVFEPCATTGTKTMQSNLVDPSVSVEETANVTKAPKKTAATKLPQTGDMDKNGGTLFGLALAGVTGLFGGLSLRKKKEDD